MSTGPVDNEGNYLCFTDTGPVPNSADYTTLIIFHGLAFTGATFQKLNPFGAASNVRIVIVNRRDYPGSTQYTDSELADLNAGNKAHLERLALEVAYFLMWFISNNDVPKISLDGRRGGFSILGWSNGIITPLAVLAHASSLQPESLRVMELYFRQVILYDPPHIALGYPGIPGAYNPLTDPTFSSPELALQHLGIWISGHFKHSGISSRSTHGLDQSRIGVRPSVENMTPLQLSENICSLAALRTELPIFGAMQPALFEMGQKALFDEVMAQDAFPRTKFVHLWCAQSFWPCIYAMYEVEKQYEGCVRQGEKIRQIRFMGIESEGANHFIHWDDPVTFWAHVVDAIYSDL